jgi:hypothetical protein
LAVFLLATGCGRGPVGGTVAATSTTTSTTATTVPTMTTVGSQLFGDYLARWSNGGIFVQITMTTATAFEGSVILHLEYQADDDIDLRNHFTGVLSSTDVLFRFDDDPDWGLGSSWSGSLISGGFNVQLPVPNGTLYTVEFRDGTVDDYNAAVRAARPFKP